MRAARRPYAWIGGGENRDHGSADGRGQVADPGVIADIHACSREPAGQCIEILETNRVIQRLFRSSRPLDRQRKAGRESAEICNRPVFLDPAGKRMNHGEVGERCRGNRDTGDSGRRRKRGEECKRQAADGFAKLRTLRAVPGIDGIELFKRGNLRIRHDAEPIEASVGDGPGAIRPADERKHGPGGPHLGVIGAGSFERGQRENAIADRARTNEEAAVHYFNP
jgi:hypothetical protein